MIKGYCQYNYKRAILNMLDTWGGEAYCDSVIDALMNGSDQFRLSLLTRKRRKEIRVETSLGTIVTPLDSNW
jgi:hypothetical protein